MGAERLGKIGEESRCGWSRVRGISGRAASASSSEILHICGAIASGGGVGAPLRISSPTT